MKLVLLLLLPLACLAQSKKTYYVEYLVDGWNKPIVHAVITNARTKQHTIPMMNGYFAIEAVQGDTLLYVMEQSSKKLVVRDYMLRSEYVQVHNVLVMPVESPDYMAAIKSARTNFDTLVRMGIDSFKRRGYFNGQAPMKIKLIHGKLYMVPQRSVRLSISGAYETRAESRLANATPALQKTYVQGRSMQGQAKWQGPETNEAFSYGPAIEQLEYDGSKYDYDSKGRIVDKGLGNGEAVQPYDNSIIRKGYSWQQYIDVAAGLHFAYQHKLLLHLELTKQQEALIVDRNENAYQRMQLQLAYTKTTWQVNAYYAGMLQTQTNGNRNAYLTRAYMQSLLTPISFNNAEGTTLQQQQRRFSYTADNPLYLLNNAQPASWQNRQGGVTVQKRMGSVTWHSTMTYEQQQQSNQEYYAMGVVNYPLGFQTKRLQENNLFTLKQSVLVQVPYSTSNYSSTASITHQLTSNTTYIDYRQTAQYAYARKAQDISMYYSTVYNKYTKRLVVDVGNQMYISNTANKQQLFLPNMCVQYSINRFLNNPDLYYQVTGNYSKSAKEYTQQKSLAHMQSLLMQASDFLQYNPTKEIYVQEQLTPIQKHQYRLAMLLTIQHNLTFSVDWYKQLTKQDVFPAWQNNQWLLQNMADHTTQGWGISIRYNNGHRKHIISYDGSVSYSQYRNKVTQLYNNQPYTMINGFANVGKALVVGEPVGVLLGNSIATNAIGYALIDADGFPVVNHALKPIGNPNPDFECKHSSVIQWKKFSFNIDLAWQHGGGIWNGTQAVLDYYGRSLTTAIERNTQQHVFLGFTQAGTLNSKPVDFYNTSLPIQQNRWVRYGYTGVASDYIERADNIRIHQVALHYSWTTKKYLNTIKLEIFAKNILLWKAYSGVDPKSLFLDIPDTQGLDFFNVPSFSSYGCAVQLHF